MEQQKNKPWVVNASEAINRTCSSIYEEYKVVIDLFNNKIIDTCNKRKHSVTYKTDNEVTCKDLHYFYNCLGYKVDIEETPNYKDGVEYTVYKIKLMW